MTHAALQQRRILPRPLRNIENRLTFLLPKSAEYDRVLILMGSSILASSDDTSEDESIANVEGNVIDSKAKKYGYKRPAHSEYFLQHMESVKSSWPYDPNDDNVSDDGADEISAKYNSVSDKGVRCTGEPSIDPSRMLQSVVDDDSHWI